MRLKSIIRATLHTPNGETREADGILVNREQVMLFRRITHRELTRGA